MHHALVLSIFSSTFLVLTTLSGSTGDTGAHFSSADDNPWVQGQAKEDAYEDKRSWRDLQSGWGKRGWKDLQGTGWGKRSWGDLRNGWGKRNPPDFENPWEKRAWSDLRGGSWGKRDWNRFRGGWGKRFVIDDQKLNFYDSPESFEKRGDYLLEDAKRPGSDKKGNSDDYYKLPESKKDNSRSSWGDIVGAWGK